MSKTFCKRLKELRLERGVKQSELGRELCVAFNTISSWERGNSRPDIEQLKQLAIFFDVTSDYLLGLED